MVYYRKYRPQTLDELIGQEHVAQALKKANLGGKLSQAYLFCGPKGTGKTSTARILAKIVNCLATSSLPCNKCEQCISITDGTNLDLIEIDAASNRGIDDIREIKEKIKLAPTSAKKKVYIIDEVHMLSTEAFNALLKTLEEPPLHVMFILATTEVHKIPETILSRVVRFDFKLGNSEDLLKVLRKIVTDEKIKIEEEALNFIAKKAGGSFRDAAKFLDQLSGFSEVITLAGAELFYKTCDFNHLISLLNAIYNKDTKAALTLCLEQINFGVNTKEYILSILGLLKFMVYIKVDLEELVQDELGLEKFKTLKALAEKFDQKDLLSLCNSFGSSLEKIKFSPVPSLPLEIAVVEATQSSNQEEMQKVGVVSKEVVIESQQTEDIVDRSTEDLLILKDKWNYILETVKPYNYSLEAMLKLVKIQHCGDGAVILEVPYSFHQRILDAPKSKSLLESVLSEVLGKGVKVSTVLGKRLPAAEELGNVEVASDDEIIKIAQEIFNSETVN